ncbi:hypothetical protein SLEP1_g22285 [Rubroshorea leprosula]|uniref:Uncharacterized protein n=1 Tax=Rubroshorea leprosula TaxID=152421 RepID=A0AAV5JEU1_9ROSI|nr:hypothetical protein SLEP1_g22285 [Rubroshorea leprosula]
MKKCITVRALGIEYLLRFKHSNWSAVDGNQDDSISTTSCDPLHTQGGPVSRVRAKKMREVLNGLVEQI